MSLDTHTVVKTNQNKLTGNEFALTLERMKNDVEHGLETDAEHGDIYAKFDVISETNKQIKKAVGQTVVQKLVPGVTPDGTTTPITKIGQEIEHLFISRSIISKIDSLVTDFNYVAALTREHKRKWVLMIDEMISIQALKGAKAATSKYDLPGFTGGVARTIPTADANDGTVIVDALSKMYADFQNKGIRDFSGFKIWVKPETYQVLALNELLNNKDYKTAEGRLNFMGIPISVTVNSVLGKNITSHELTTTNNSFTGNFTNDLLMFGNFNEGIWGVKLEEVKFVHHYDKLSVADYIDSFFGATCTYDRNEYLGVLSLV